MTKLNFLLLLVVIASALVLVKSAYDVRRLTSEIHRAEMEAQRLAGDQTRLEA
ncbi:MAG: cell division protein FtsL, partial [Burkholderiales bacterium PBB5]